MTTKQLDALELAEDFADWQAAKGRDHPATQEARQKLSSELRRLYAENQQLTEMSLEQAKINGSGAERELRLMAELDEVKRMILRDEALLRRALTYLEYASQQLPMIHASIVDPIVGELKERLK